jgi:uncharacterized HAD superfamily protein
MKIGFDLDGVLYPWHKYFYELVSNRYSEYSEMGYRYFWSKVKTFEKEDERLTKLVSLPGLYMKGVIDEDILYYITELSKRNEIYYVTCRPANATKATIMWMTRNALPSSPENLYMLDESKRDKVIELDLDYYVEDRLEHLEDLKDITNVLLVRHPWNNYGKDIDPSFKDTKEALLYLINTKGL